MGKRGPKANPEKSGKTDSFYAPNECHASIQALKLSKETKGDVICMSVELATRMPEEFEKIRQERKAKSESDTTP